MIWFGTVEVLRKMKIKMLNGFKNNKNVHDFIYYIYKVEQNI